MPSNVQIRPVRRAVPTSKLMDTNNSEMPELSFQRRAVHDFRQVQESRPPPELPGGASTEALAALPTSAGADSDGIEGNHEAPGMSVFLMR